MASADDIVTVSFGDGQMHTYALDSDAQQIGAAGNYGQLKPIIMTMANMANVSEEVSVSTQEQELVQQEPDLSDNILRSHLLSSKIVREMRNPQLSEVFEDEETGVSYEILRGGTKRGGDRLLDSLGFMYNHKRSTLSVTQQGRKDTVYWWCAVRNSKLRCPAVVVQRGKSFMRGKHKHEHLVGQNTPKPHMHRVGALPSDSSTPTGRRVSKQQKPVFGRQDYVIIKEGSKAGLDLLKDKFGYQFTQKKVLKDGRRYWICSVRNKTIRCPAMVIQDKNQFTEGSLEHKHMPGVSQPLRPGEVIPRHGVHQQYTAPDDNEDEYENEDASDAGELDDSSFSETPTRGSGVTGNWSSHVPKVSQKQRMYARARKRKDHPTFLGPSCTINLTKCDVPTCNCKMVHCPFCDPSHFIPAKAGRVQDHLELTHFAHGVQYDDLMIVKCFQDCSAERTYGHYHCVFCCQQILKRNAYARHMLRHMRKLGIPDRLLVLPDSKFPDVINAYGFEIPICKKVQCTGTRDKHYHCPQCQSLCKERSLTVNHLWRCLQRKTEAEAVSDEEEAMNSIDENQLNLHFSHYKNFNELPLTKCDQPNCCSGMYHCRLCPPRQFVPTYKQHLVAHYITHWKQRVPYKGYSMLRCFQYCNGVDRSYHKVRYHFHCPICCKMILTKPSFEDHLKGCHLFKFGENLLHEKTNEADQSMEDDMELAAEMSHFHDNVDYMEEKLTAQAQARAHERRKGSAKGWTSTYGGKFRTPKQTPNKDLGKMLKVIKSEMLAGQDTSHDDTMQDTDLEDDIFGLNIKADEIFDIGTGVFSEKLIKALTSAALVTTVLEKVALLTNTRLTQEDGRYMLCGKLEDLLAAKQLVIKTIEGSESDAEQEMPSSPDRKSGRSAKKPKNSTVEETSKATHKGKEKSKKEAVVAKKRTPGRPKKKADSFPYSEIEEIIEASKKTDKGKKGPTRPPKKLPLPKTLKSKEPIQEAATPTTPGRYGTRGVKRDYLEMSRGVVVVKQEVISDDELGEGSEEDEEEVEEEMTPRRRKSGAQAGAKRGRPRKQAVEDEEEEESVESLDDSEQEELDQFSDNQDEGGDEDRDIENEELPVVENVKSEKSKVILLSPSQMIEDDENDNKASGGAMSKITDSTVQNLKTSNVKSSIPLISKVGIRTVKVGSRKVNEEEKVAMEKEMEKVAQSLKGDNLRCSLCDEYQAETFSELTNHLKTFHHVYEPPRCDVCEMDFDNCQSLANHIEKKHGPKMQQTVFKSKAFPFQQGLMAHDSKVHVNGETSSKEKKYDCETCHFKTNSRADLWEHKKIKHNEAIECKSCNMVFVNYQTLKSHNEAKHVDDGELNCEICNKHFRSKWTLFRHLKLHNSAKYTCTHCNKKISTKASFEDHLETHKPENERQYRYHCVFCGKGFRVKTNYEDHLNKHTGNRPYQCDQCLKSFGFRSMLKKHKTFMHSAERPFKCGYCMKGFKFMNLLKNHMTIHTNVSKHTCFYCNKIFSTASSLKFHMRKCSQVQKPPTEATQQSGMVVIYPSGQGIITVSEASMVEVGGVRPMGIPVIAATQVPFLPGEQNVVITESSGQILSGDTRLVVPDEGVAMGSNLVTMEITDQLTDAEAIVEATSHVATQLELFACSECSATFHTYGEAETHITTAHCAIPLTNM